MTSIMSNACRRLSLGILLVLLGLPRAGSVSAQVTEPKAFASPQEAVSALIKAARKKDSATMLAVLGSKTKEWISSGDPVQDRQGLEAFISAFDQKNEIEKEDDGKAVLVIGNDGFPFPFPVVKKARGWAFDPQQGREELLDRRIGRNELTTMQVMLAINDAQIEYASVDRNGDGVLEYAAKFGSAPGKKDGLYWPTAQGTPLSPLGPLIADAVEEGYRLKKKDSGSEESNAFHGYRFKLLKRQGAEAPDGAYDYMVGGKMIGGFAVVAYPARYGNSGIMTFMSNHDGTVFEADLGSETAEAANAMDTFNPGADWKKAEPE